jgi:ribosomal protein S18 acetylase RimI-like enzyme
LTSPAGRSHAISVSDEWICAVEVIDLDFASAWQREGFLDVLDSYARDPIGGGSPLGENVRARLLPGLSDQGHAVVLLAIADESVLGTAVCFLGYSTFAAAPLLNIHDLAVLPQHRGMGIGHALLEAVDRRAKALGCCKITLEVREDNTGARALYERLGFSDYTQAGMTIPTLFLEKKLEKP